MPEADVGPLMDKNEATFMVRSERPLEERHIKRLESISGLEILTTLDD